MNLIVTLAVGDKKWGSMALNLAMSIKAQTPDQKILLIYNQSAIEDIKPHMDKFFDYGYLQYENQYDNYVELAFYLKSQLYKIIDSACKGWDNAIFLDADSIMLAGRKVDEWFKKHEGQYFDAYCNDTYSFSSKKRKRKDYTFWCEPELAREHYNIPLQNKMPQINCSFIYLSRTPLCRTFFENVEKVWLDDTFEGEKYKGVKVDEMCFNIASAITNLYPSQNTYRPLFLQFASETQNPNYVAHYFRAFSFAGMTKPADYLTHLYNELAHYYAEHFCLTNYYKYDKADKLEYKPLYLSINPIARRTMFRQGELPNSDGGVFNPSGLGNVVIMRKELPLLPNGKAYTNASAIPHLYSYDGEGKELAMQNMPDARIEDFRLFRNGQHTLVNHSVVEHGSNSALKSKVGLSMLKCGELIFLGIPKLPIETKQAEKNWLFFSEGDITYCIYNISPLVIFKCVDNVWQRCEFPATELEWFHKNEYICGSTNPIRIGEYYFLMYHTKQWGVYYHGAMLLDVNTKEVKHYTRNPIWIQNVGEGMHRGLIFVSGAQYFEGGNVLRIFYGEGDSHACYNDYNANDFLELIKLDR